MLPQSKTTKTKTITTTSWNDESFVQIFGLKRAPCVTAVANMYKSGKQKW